MTDDVAGGAAASPARALADLRKCIDRALRAFGENWDVEETPGADDTEEDAMLTTRDLADLLTERLEELLANNVGAAAVDDEKKRQKTAVQPPSDCAEQVENCDGSQYQSIECCGYGKNYAESPDGVAGQNEEELGEEGHSDDGSSIKGRPKSASTEKGQKKRKLEEKNTPESSTGVTFKDGMTGGRYSSKTKALKSQRDSEDGQMIENQAEVSKGISDATASESRNKAGATEDVNDGGATSSKNPRSIIRQNRFDARWDAMFEELKAFKRVHGHAFIPTKSHDVERKKIGGWVNMQRVQYREYLAGRRSSLTQERIDRLRSVGFQFDGRHKCTEVDEENGDTTYPDSAFAVMRERKWTAMFEKLKAFKCENGHMSVPAENIRLNGIDTKGENRHMLVPAETKDDLKKLASWINGQRRKYSLFLAGRPSTLTQERIDKLSSIGFQFRNNGKRDAKDWDAMYHNLFQYWRRHGHSNVPSNDNESGGEEGILGQWVQSQRSSYQILMEDKPSSLTRDRIDKLNKVDFNFSLGDRERKPWEQMIEDLDSYHKEHGNFDDVLSDKELGEWVSEQKKQRDRLNAGKLSPMTEERLAKLTRIGVFSLKGDEQMKQVVGPKKGFKGGYTHKTWDQWFELLRDFKRANGHIRVPTQSHSPLNSWIGRQHREYKKLREGKSSRLTVAQFERLRDLGYEFRPKVSKSWDERVEELRKFAKEHGHCCVPRSYPGLGQFVSVMRTRYSHLMNGKPSKPLTKERVKELESIGMVWQLHRPQTPVEHKTWEERYQELIQFRKLHGHCKVPVSYGPLGGFVREQRKFYNLMKQGRKSRMTPERMVKLAEIGFAFHLRPYRKKEGSKGDGVNLQPAAARAAAWQRKMDSQNQGDSNKSQTKDE